MSKSAARRPRASTSNMAAVGSGSISSTRTDFRSDIYQAARDNRIWAGIDKQAGRPGEASGYKNLPCDGPRRIARPKSVPLATIEPAAHVPVGQMRPLFEINTHQIVDLSGRAC